jgi:hypothetical protein
MSDVDAVTCRCLHLLLPSPAAFAALVLLQVLVQYGLGQ